jgi:hypothetical protein
MGRHGLAEAVQIEVDEDVLKPLAVWLQAQDGLREGAVVLCDARVLGQLAQLLDNALVVPRVLEVGGEGVDVLAVGLPPLYWLCQALTGPVRRVPVSKMRSLSVAQ